MSYLESRIRDLRTGGKDFRAIRDELVMQHDAGPLDDIIARLQREETQHSVAAAHALPHSPGAGGEDDPLRVPE